MSSKVLPYNLITWLYIIIIFTSVFLLANSEKEVQKTIFDETYLKHLKLKNRIFRGSIGELTMQNGKISDEGFKLYDQLSKGEVGTIFTGSAAISDYDNYGEFKVFRIDKDEYIPEFKKLVDMVHKNGANIMMQLVHIGIKALSKEGTVYAPSSLPLDDQNRLSKEMTKEDILRIENDFAEAAL